MDPIASSGRDLLNLTMRSIASIIAGELIFLDRYIQSKFDGVKIYILVSPDTAPSSIVPTAVTDRTN